MGHGPVHRLLVPCVRPVLDLVSDGGPAEDHQGAGEVTPVLQGHMNM